MKTCYTIFNEEIGCLKSYSITDTININDGGMDIVYRAGRRRAGTVWQLNGIRPNYIIPSLGPSVTPITTEIWGRWGADLCGGAERPILLVTEGYC
jgi:hypothetical protein